MPQVKCQIFRGCQRHLRRDQTLYNRIVRQVQIRDNVIRNAALFKRTSEEISDIVLNAHRRKDDRKFFVRIRAQGSLLYDLRSQLVMRQSVSGEDRQLLSSDQRGQSVDRGNTGLDKVPGILPGHRDSAAGR